MVQFAVIAGLVCLRTGLGEQTQPGQKKLELDAGLMALLHQPKLNVAHGPMMRIPDVDFGI